jgi:glutathione-specific gamma-glutamylcyclotransferase
MATPLTQTQLRASLDATLARWDGRSDIGLFAYGSLIWKPEAGMLEPALARVHGYHRAFCLWSRINRGTYDVPGLVLALAPGGSCLGVVYRVPANHAPGLLAALWQREMLLGSYVPRWVRTSHADPRIGPLALAFVINRRAHGYTGPLSLAQQADHIARGCGRYGHACDYLFDTEAALTQWGIADRHLRRLSAQVRERLQRRCPP